MSIVTLGLDPLQSKVTTLGYGPDVTVIITVVSERIGGRSSKRRRERIIRIQVLDDDGKKMIQEQLINEDELSNIKLKVSESAYIDGSDLSTVSIYIKEVNKPKELKVKIHETKKR